MTRELLSLEKQKVASRETRKRVCSKSKSLGLSTTIHQQQDDPYKKDPSLGYHENMGPCYLDVASMMVIKKKGKDERVSFDGLGRNEYMPISRISNIMVD